MKTFAAAVTLGVASAFTPMEFKYMQHLAKFGKNMASVEEFNQRMAIFGDLDKFIEEHKAEGHNYTLGRNQFSDWSHSEYTSLLGYIEKPIEDRTFTIYDESSNDMTVNWVEAGAVTPVKDQGQCGSCWSFSSTGALEGEHFIKTGDLLSFSEQQLVSCSKLNLGCNGGNQSLAFKYWKTHKAELESTYPYVSGTGQNPECAYDEGSATSVEVTSNGFVTQDSVSQMKAALAVQPLSVSIEADKRVFQTYTSGVLDSDQCGTQLDHAVLTVGWGNDAETGLDYWLVKNSWNTTWGDQGYIKLAIVDGQGICGVQMGPLTVESN